MTQYWLLLVYCILIVLASLAGGLVPLLVRLTHKRMQITISLVAGFMLGVALLVLLPHALEVVSAHMVVRCMVAGLLTMFFLERFFCFHHHDAPGDNPPVAEDGGNQTSDACAKPSSALAGAHEHRLSWSGAMMGLTIHSAIAGVALAAAMHSEVGVVWPGLAVFGVIFLHKPFDSLTLGTLMATGGYSVAVRHLVNGLFALAVPLGAGLFYLGLAISDIENSQVIGGAVAFSAGVFLIISLSDLLPELQFHHHDRGKLSAALLLGIALAFAVSLFEESGHGPEPAQESPSAAVGHPDPSKGINHLQLDSPIIRQPNREHTTAD